MDAPAHFAEGGRFLAEIPADRLNGPAVVIDISNKTAQSADAELEIKDLVAWESEYGEIPDGAYVFMYSNWSPRWPDESRYFGSATNDLTDLHYPGFSIEAADWLVQNRNIYAVGVDTCSPDGGIRTTFPVHTLLCGKDIFIMENVGNLDQVPPSGATVYAFPMKIKFGSGGPARIIAYIPEDNACGSIHGARGGVMIMVAIMCIIELFYAF